MKEETEKTQLNLWISCVWPSPSVGRNVIWTHMKCRTRHYTNIIVYKFSFTNQTFSWICAALTQMFLSSTLPLVFQRATMSWWWMIVFQLFWYMFLVSCLLSIEKLNRVCCVCVWMESISYVWHCCRSKRRMCTPNGDCNVLRAERANECVMSMW